MPDRSQFEVIKAAVRAVSAYMPEQVSADVKLDQNENPYELPADLKKDVVDQVLARDWGRYPEFVPKSLINSLARFTGWTSEGILVGNGSNELINAALAVTLQPGSTIVIPQPTFTLYSLISTTMGAKIVEVMLNEKDLSFNIEATMKSVAESDVSIICSPNNPTGTTMELKDAERIIETARGLVILDEAYHEFSEQTALPLLERHENLILLRTFSKAMSMAGLRFGYMLAHPRIAREIEKARLPYSVNIFTLVAAELAIERYSICLDSINALIQERASLAAELCCRQQVEVFPSKANFILIKTPHPGSLIFEELHAQGVLVRDVSHYPLLDRAVRVSVGRPEENTRFLNALDRALEKLE